MSFFAFLSELPLLAKKHNGDHKTATAQRIPPARQEGNGHANPPALPNPIRIDMRTGVAALLAKGESLSARWKEKVRSHQTLWAMYEKTKIPPSPELYWDFTASTARLSEDTELFRRQVEEHWKQLQEIVERHCQDTGALLAFKDQEREELINARHKDVEGLQAQIAALTASQNSGREEAQSACEAQIAKFKGDYVSEVQKLQESHSQELVNLEGVYQNRLSVAQDEAKKWRNMYVKKGRKR